MSRQQRLLLFKSESDCVTGMSQRVSAGPEVTLQNSSRKISICFPGRIVAGGSKDIVSVIYKIKDKNKI